MNSGSVSSGLKALDSLRPATAPLASSLMLSSVPLEHSVEKPRGPLGYTSEQPGISISPTGWRLTRSTTVTEEAGVKLNTSAMRCSSVKANSPSIAVMSARFAPGRTISPTGFNVCVS